MLFQKSLKLFFMAAQFLLTVRTIQTQIGFGGKTLGMTPVCDFPAKQQSERTAQKRVGVYARDENQRGEHHGKIPIIDPAAGAAAVFHKPGLKRAKEQNANNITDRICNCNYNQNSPVNQSRIVKNSNHAVKKDPRPSNRRRPLPGLVHRRYIVAFRPIITPKLLLTAHTLQF